MASVLQPPSLIRGLSLIRRTPQAQIQAKDHHRGLSSQVPAETHPTTHRGVAIVTGASRGIGKAIALRLASDGFDVGLNDLPSSLDALRKVSEEIHHIHSSSGKNGKGRTLLCPGDVSAEDDVKGMVQSCVDELGGIDVMISNAGICYPKRSILEHTTADWDKIMRINVRGTFLCYKYAAEQMIRQSRGGRIIGACSIAGKKGGPEFSSYCTSKFAVRGLTQSAALEWATHGITVNAYAPGPIESDMLELITKRNEITQVEGVSFRAP